MRRLTVLRERLTNFSEIRIGVVATALLIAFVGYIGFQATARIREQESVSGKHMQIVTMIAHALKGDLVRCLEAGMDGYVSKPIRNSELFAAISNVMNGTGAPPAVNTGKTVEATPRSRYAPAVLTCGSFCKEVER